MHPAATTGNKDLMIVCARIWLRESYAVPCKPIMPSCFSSCAGRLCHNYGTARVNESTGGLICLPRELCTRDN